MRNFLRNFPALTHRLWSIVGAGLMMLGGAAETQAACPGCTTFNPGIEWGTPTFSSLGEASGLAVSTFNPGVLWSHNDDGNDGRLFAFRTNGTGLARFQTHLTLTDVEDMAIGPGPVPNVSYLYVGDIGGKGLPGEARNQVKVVRVAEPVVSQAWAGNPPTPDLAGVEVFTLKYPRFPFNFDPYWDAETLMVDPLNGDVYVGTKHDNGLWLYRVNLNGATPGTTNEMEFVTTVLFYQSSGGAISADGSLIALRNEAYAQIWQRCPGETIGAALARSGPYIPVSGAEINGEAIAFLPNNRGYVTLSDSTEQPPIHFFSAICPLTVLTQSPQPATVPVGGNAQFTAAATGENLFYHWRFNGTDLPGETNTMLSLTGVQLSHRGQYSVRVLGNGGAVTSSPATLTVVVLPPVISAQPPGTTLAATGSTVRIDVGVQGTAPFAYAWFFGRRALTNQTGATLTLTNVSRRSTGLYRVVVTNSAGKATSAYARLKVYYPPVISSPPLGKTVATGARVTLRVRAKGSPRLRYQWLFNDTPITNAVRTTLALRNLQPAQSGLYSVRVTNLVGTATSIPAQLTVQ